MLLASLMSVQTVSAQPSAADLLGGGGGSPPQMCSVPTTPSNPGAPAGNECVGNPINVTGGNKFQREVDFNALPGVLGLELVRYYNSDYSRYLSGEGPSKRALGRGWRTNYDTDLDTHSGKQSGEIHFFSADGKKFTYRNSAKAPLVFSSGRQGDASRIERSGTGAAERFTLRQGDGTRFVFDANGWMLETHAPSGEVLRVQRDAQSRLQKVTDPQGRELVFHYVGDEGKAPGSGSAKQVQRIDTPLGSFSYAFGDSNAAPSKGSKLESLARTQALASSLSQVTAPDGSVRQYHYEDAAHPTLLTGISVKASSTASSPAAAAGVTSQGGAQGEWTRTVSWAYNDEGQAIRSVKGAIPAEGKSGAQDVRLDFQKGPKTSSGYPSGVTILTNSLGQRTRYEYTEQNGRTEITQVLGAGCVSCGPANVRSQFDAQGQLIERIQLSPVQISADGQARQTPQPLSATRYSRDPQGRVVRVEQVIYNAAGKALPPQLITRTEYNDSRWPDKATLMARPSVIPGKEHTTWMSYNAAGQVTQVKESGYSPVDAQGQLAGLADQASKLERATVYTYQSVNGRSVLAQIDGPLPNGPSNSPIDSDITRYEWDAKADHLQAVQHPLGLREQFAYELEGENASGRLIGRTGVNGVQTTLRWDGQGHMTQMQSAGLAVSLAYDPQGRVVRYERNDGATITAAYDDANYRVAYTLPDGEVMRRQLDSEQRLLSAGWQATGQAKQADETLVAQTQVEYDTDFNRPRRWTDAAGVATELSFDAQGRLASQQRGPLTTSQSFDPAEHLLQVQRNEALTQIQGGEKGETGGAQGNDPNDPSQAQRSLTLPTGATHRQWRDDFGRVVRIETPDSGTHRAAYDLADRQTERWDSSRHSSARYDALGRLIQMRHANTGGNSEGASNVQSASAVVKAIVSAEEEITWQYDGTQLVRQTSSQQDKRFAYDDFGRVIEERLSLRRQKPTGHATGTKEAAKESAEKSSDWLPALTTRYERDRFGRIQRMHLPEGATLTQTYNAQGSIEALSLQDPASHWWQKAIRWVWAEQGTRELISRIQASSSQGLKSYQQGNGSAASAQHDSAGRLSQWQDGPQTTQLGYDKTTAQLATLKSTAPARPGPTLAAAQTLKGGEASSREQNLSYDPFGRLRQVSEGSGKDLFSQVFDYDRNGNRLLLKQEGLASASAQGSESGEQKHKQKNYQLAPASDRLLAVKTTAGQILRGYQYNEAGEPIQIETGNNKEKDHKTLNYNAQGQIAAVEQDGQLLASYAYNGARQRVAKTVHAAQAETTALTAGNTTYFTWHGGLLEAELDAQGRVQRRTIYLNLRPVALVDYGYSDSKENNTTPEETQRYAIHSDQLGTPQAITDENQTVVWLAKYDAFGKAQTQALPRSRVVAHNGFNKTFSWIGTAHASTAEGSDKPFEFNLRFAGQYEDTETGWHYNWHRFYDPETGRYLTPDPIGLRGGENAYGYVGADPFGAVDPWGLQSTPLGGANSPPSNGHNFQNAPHETYGERAAQYRIMQQMASQQGIDVVWFGVAANLNQAFEAAPLVPGGAWMNELGQFLYNENIDTFNEVMQPPLSGTCSMGGTALDSSLVYREQNAAQRFIDSNPLSSYQRVEIDLGFSLAGRLFMPAYMRTALANVEAQKGGRNFDFWNVSDRISLGETLMDHERGVW